MAIDVHDGEIFEQFTILIEAVLFLAINIIIDTTLTRRVLAIQTAAPTCKCRHLRINPSIPFHVI